MRLDYLHKFAFYLSQKSNESRYMSSIRRPVHATTIIVEQMAHQTSVSENQETAAFISGKKTQWLPIFERCVVEIAARDPCLRLILGMMWGHKVFRVRILPICRPLNGASEKRRTKIVSYLQEMEVCGSSVKLVSFLSPYASNVL